MSSLGLAFLHIVFESVVFFHLDFFAAHLLPEGDATMGWALSVYEELYVEYSIDMHLIILFTILFKC